MADTIASKREEYLQRERLERIRKAAPAMLEALEKVVNRKWEHNVFSEPLCPICSYPNKHKKGCPYPLAEKAIALAKGQQ